MDNKKVCRFCNKIKLLELFVKKEKRCIACRNEYNSLYRLKHKGYFKRYSKNYHFKNKDKILARKRDFFEKNKEKIKSRWRKRNIDRTRNDLCYRLVKNLRSRINKAVKLNIKSKKTKKLLGCDINYFKFNLESRFKVGMSWKNYGEWHIDHIKPCSSFDFSKPEEQYRCFHYSNLQPLWKEENLEKSDKYEM